MGRAVHSGKPRAKWTGKSPSMVEPLQRRCLSLCAWQAPASRAAHLLRMRPQVQNCGILSVSARLSR